MKNNELLKLLDLGSNTGQYCRSAISAGAEQVIGVDSDCGAIDIAAIEARRNAWPAQFLYFDIANPSSNMGWGHRERTTLEKRLIPLDGIFCFALIHHLVIGRNIPMAEFIGWVCRLAPRGLIEFVPKRTRWCKTCCVTGKIYFMITTGRILKGYCAKHARRC